VKKRYLIIGLLASTFSLRAQKQDTTYQKRKLHRTEVQMVFSYYNQDNNHSAVTGGIGTEKLKVYAQQVNVDFIKDSTRTFHLDAGVDVITSASTDNIDYVRSSASEHDGRYHATVGYNRFLKNKRTSIGGVFAFSVESDYLSFGPGITLNHINVNQSNEISLSIQAFFDDLRWFDEGRLSTLIYPFELRNQNWFDIYKRNSYNVNFGFHQTLTRRMSIGIYPGLSYQSGLLSTPFHRIYFNDNALRVENLPQTRLRIPVAVQLNTFLGSRLIARTYYRYYQDDFDITAHTFNLEMAIKISRKISITPFMRWYNQTASKFFNPYKEHSIQQEFYTSDYDLSEFNSIKPGMSLRFAPYSQKGRRTFEDIEIRYARYERSDGLHANMITLYFGYDVEHK
jgi:hypothetical protein